MRKSNSKTKRTYSKARRLARINRKREAEKFNKVVASLIKDYWPDADVQVYAERIGIRKPDIEVIRNGLIIPIEVKTRWVPGYFNIKELRDGRSIICFNGCNLAYRNSVNEYFRCQTSVMLGKYGISLFLVNAEVYPQTPVSRHERGGLVLLSNFQTMELSLEIAYDFLTRGYV